MLAITQTSVVRATGQQIMFSVKGHPEEATEGTLLQEAKPDLREEQNIMAYRSLK